MLRSPFLLWVVLAGVAGLAAPDIAGAQSRVSATPLSVLEQRARARMSGSARIELAPVTAPVFRDVPSFEGRTDLVPNYLRAAAVKPALVKPLSAAVRTIAFGGHVQPALKLAMGVRIAQINASPYAAVHLSRLLRASSEGPAWLQRLQHEPVAGLSPAELIALRWAEAQTVDIHGMTEEEFRTLRGHFSDSEVVELTFVVSFFNYFTRLVEGLSLPVEAWALDATVVPTVPNTWVRDRAPARVSLISDEEIQATGEAQRAAVASKDNPGGLGLGLANSQRAMMRVPDMARAWRDLGAATGLHSSVGRDVLLQVSFAVSMANGCRYCTIHQIVGLRRIGVDPGKLVAMAKDDRSLTARELAAVVFARKLTRQPGEITNADYANVTSTFNAQGALEVLLQACTFNFMNRFTDGLRLPSEDEAIRIYRDVYGRDFSH